MARHRLSDRTAVIGVGKSRITRQPDKPVLVLIADAIRAAVADAGLTLPDIDGMIVAGGSPNGSDYDSIINGLGLRLRHCDQTWSHGRMTNPGIINAVMALDAGLADYILVLRGCAFASQGRVGGEKNPEEFRETQGAHGENPVYGFGAPAAGAAMVLRRYLLRYGGSAEQLAAIPVAMRKHAMLNPDAVYREQMTVESYLRCRYVVDPLRVFDCAAVTNAAGALVLTTADRARNCRKRPVFVAGFQGLHASRDEHPFGLPGLGVFQQDTYDYKPDDLRAYEMAGISRDDVDVLGILDSFTPQVICTLERFGFSRPGETLDWIQGGRIELGGALPLNTSGGHFSEGHICGFGQVVEGVKQLRGECGPRQVEGATIFQYAHSAGDTVIFRI